jgi:uncharacterized repeat protein (TIGR03803 family)
MPKIRSFSTALVLVLVLAALTTVGQAQAFSVLYNFGANDRDAIHPGTPGVLAQGRDGDLYGTTGLGGAYGNGTVFKITPGGTLMVMHSFDCVDTNRRADGCYPYSGLTLGTDGNFYGAAAAGGPGGNNYGTLFKITPSGKLTVLYRFTNGADGASPAAPPIEGRDGNFYGVTGLGYGSVYRITPSGHLTSIYTFDYTHGAFAYEPLLLAANGSFYGTTTGGGARGYGTVFKISSSGALTVLYNFDSTHGSDPSAPLIQASDGNFYGTTATGGTNSDGVVFRITPTGNLTVLHDFDGTDGMTSEAALLQGTGGKFYSTCYAGGTQSNGTIYQIDGKGGFSVVYNFDNTTGAQPAVSLLQHTNGILYGDASNGGTHSDGTFYTMNLRLKPFASFIPSSGKVGKSVGIFGQGFDGTTGVSFNGISATFTVVSRTYLTATVPNGATTGFVTVTTPKRKLTSNKKFRVL